MPERVALVCCWLLDSKGEHLTMGGSQHYTLQLGRMLRDAGRQVRILQKASAAFNKTVEGLPVKGIPTAARFWGMGQFSKAVAKELEPDELAIYVYMEAASPKTHHPSIAVQHGIAWAGDEFRYRMINSFRRQPALLRSLNAVVCVDTAYINWVHTQIPGREHYASKLRYIPNFVDLQQYKESARWADNEDERTVLFPRRMYAHRGPRLLFDAMARLWQQGRRYRVVFCGPGPFAEEMLERSERLGCRDRVEIRERPFEEMPAEYARSQVAVIPTVAFEGTSLSCIEAMAAGTPVVVTHIGGLANLVIPGHNGLCTDLREEDLARAIDQVLQSRDLWTKLSRNGMETAQALDLPRWRDRWMEVIQQVTSPGKEAPIEFS